LLADLEKFPVEIVRLMTGVLYVGGSPGGEVITRQQQQLQNELDKKRQYYNQIRASDEFSAREVLREIKSLEKQISMLEVQIVQAPKVTPLTKWAFETFAQSY